MLMSAGEELGVVLPVREPPLPGRRRAEPAQGVQDAADGRAGPGEAARRLALQREGKVPLILEHGHGGGGRTRGPASGAMAPPPPPPPGSYKDALVSSAS